LEPTFAPLEWVLRPRSRVVVLMTHPAFRQPRHAGWGFDPARKLVYRRVDAYLTPMAVPMKAIGAHAPTRSYHRPLSAYVNGLAAFGFTVDAMRELPDLPAGLKPGRRLSTPDARANAEIPLLPLGNTGHPKNAVAGPSSRGACQRLFEVACRARERCLDRLPMMANECSMTCSFRESEDRVDSVPASRARCQARRGARPAARP